MKFKSIGRSFILSGVFLLTACGKRDVSDLENYLSRARLPYLKSGRTYQISSNDTTGGNNDRINIPTGQTATIANLDGPGVITRIWITIDSRDPYYLRRILLRFYWDGETNPSVEVPVGDFFGTGFGYKHYISEYLGMTSGGYYCYFPMPFNKFARMEVVNETGQEVFAFYYHIDYYRMERPLEKDVAYFHAQFRRDIRTNYPENYTIMEAYGEGHFVGVNMSMQPYQKSLWYLEGDEMIYIDGEEKPSICGTGTEDYFTSGWYFNNGEFSAAYHGLIIKDDETGRIAAYRHHIPDAIPFKKSIRVTIEHGHANAEIIDFSSVAFWYQKEPHRKFEPIKVAGLRIPLRFVIPNGAFEAEDARFESQTLNGQVESSAGFGAEWSGTQFFKIANPAAGQEFDLTIPNLDEIGYNVEVCYTKGPDYGKFDIFYGNKRVGEVDGFNTEVLPAGPLSLGELAVQSGTIHLRFIAAGKSEKASGTDIGLDCFIMRPKRVYIPEWYVIGPFPNERESDILRYGLDTVFPPEKEIDYSKSYFGTDGQTVRWKKFVTPENGYISLWDKFKPYEFAIAYAVTHIYSPEEQTVDLLIGSDDGAKVFLNGTERYRFLDVRISAPDQDRIKLPLEQGWNELLLKIENNFGGWAFYARIIDRERNLTISTAKNK